MREGWRIPLDLACGAARLLRQQYSVNLDTKMLIGPKNGITEVLVAPRSPLIGTRIFTGMATPRGDLVVLAGAPRRRRSSRAGHHRSRSGDALLLQGTLG